MGYRGFSWCWLFPYVSFDFWCLSYFGIPKCCISLKFLLSLLNLISPSVVDFTVLFNWYLRWLKVALISQVAKSCTDISGVWKVHVEGLLLYLLFSLIKSRQVSTNLMSSFRSHFWLRYLISDFDVYQSCWYIECYHTPLTLLNLMFTP